MLYRKMLISWSSAFEILVFLYQIKDNQARFIVKEKYRNSEMQSLRYKENCKAVSETRQEQPGKKLYRKILISLSPGFVILIFLYQIKANQASFILKEKYWNTEIQSLRYKENRKAVSERRQEQPSATLYILVIGFRNSNFFISNQR